MTDRQTILDGNDTAVAVTDEAAEGTASRSYVIVNNIAVEKTVGDVCDSCTIIVHITYNTTIVTAATCIITIQSARVCTVFDDCLINSGKHTAKDTALSAASTCVIDVHKAVDIADCGVAVACISSNTASVLEGGVICPVDVEILNESTCRDDAKQAEVVLL